MSSASNPNIKVGEIRKNGREAVFVSLSEFAGRHTIDIRVFSPATAADVMMPTKAGVTVAIEKLPALAALLAAAEARARTLGLLSGDAQ